MGGIKPAVERVRSHSFAAIEIEASNLDEVRQCVDLQVQRILLDNMEDELLSQALQLIPDTIETEASEVVPQRSRVLSFPPDSAGSGRPDF